MKQKIKSFISLKATSAMFGLLFFVALAGGVVINVPNASAVVPTFTAERTGLDAITLTFSEDVDTTTTAGEGYTLSTGTVTANTDPGGTGPTMVLTTSGITGTSATPTVTYGVAAGTTVNAGVEEVADGTNAVASDGVSPTVALTYTADPAKAGAMTITATYSEEIVGTPAISIDQQGITDISAVNMTSSDQIIWTYSYTVVAADGSTYIDGTAIVSLSTVADAASNNAVSPTNTTFTIDTTAPVMISATYKDTDDDGTVDSIDVTYSEDIGSSTFVESEWSFLPDPNAHNLVVVSGSISSTDVYITVTSDSETINGTEVKYTITAGTDGGITDGVNYAVNAELLIGAEEEEEEEEGDEDDIEVPGYGTERLKQPNPNSGVTLYTVDGDPRVYVIKNKKKRWIHTPKEFEANGYKWNEIQEISAELLEKYPDAEDLVTELLRAIGDYKVYKLEGGKKHWIRTAGEFNAAGYSWGDIQEVSSETLASYQNAVLSELLRAVGDHKVYKLKGGKKQWVRTVAEFNAAGYRWEDIEEVTAETLDDYPDSETL